jgi:hypothetical protein
MLDAHAAAVLALLDAVNDPPPLNVHDGKVPAGVDPRTSPYVLAYFAAHMPGRTFTGVSHEFQLRITLHCVGGSTRAARMVRDRVAVALIDVAPTVAGRQCDRIRVDEGGQEPQPNEVTGSTVVDYVETYVLRSIPA